METPINNTASVVENRKNCDVCKREIINSHDPDNCYPEDQRYDETPGCDKCLIKIGGKKMCYACWADYYLTHDDD